MLNKCNFTWDDYQSTTSKTFNELRKEKYFFDVTLVSDDGQQKIPAHKVVLAACSGYFKDILKQANHQHPLVCLQGVTAKELDNVLDYIYSGEIQLPQENVRKFLDVAKRLKLKGLFQNDIKNFNSTKCEVLLDEQELEHSDIRNEELPEKSLMDDTTELIISEPTSIKLEKFVMEPPEPNSVETREPQIVDIPEDPFHIGKPESNSIVTPGPDAVEAPEQKTVETLQPNTIWGPKSNVTSKPDPNTVENPELDTIGRPKTIGNKHAVKYTTPTLNSRSTFMKNITFHSDHYKSIEELDKKVLESLEKFKIGRGTCLRCKICSKLLWHGLEKSRDHVEELHLENILYQCNKCGKSDQSRKIIRRHTCTLRHINCPRPTNPPKIAPMPPPLPSPVEILRTFNFTPV